MTGSESRAWYRLHFSTWMIVALTLAVLALIMTPGHLMDHVSSLGSSFHVEHGWPFVWLDRFVPGTRTWDPATIPWDVPERNAYLAAQGLRRVSDGDMNWTSPHRWHLYGYRILRWDGLLLDALVAFGTTAAVGGLWEWRRRRRWQFKVRSLLVLVVVLSAGLAWWRGATVQQTREDALINELNHHGFIWRRSSAGPGWLCRLISWDRVPHVVDHIQGNAGPHYFLINDDGTISEPTEPLSPMKRVTAVLKIAADFQDLESVSISSANDEILSLVASLSMTLQDRHGSPGLRELDVDGSDVTDAGMKHLEGITSLTTMYIIATNVTDAGLRHLQPMTQLQQLYISDMQITDDGLKYLEGMTNLTALHISDTGVTDAGLRYLQAMTQLQQLHISDMQITDDGLKYLEGMTNLTALHISDTGVTDVGLRHLEGLTQLRLLDIANTNVTADAVGRLQRTLPDCSIIQQ